MMMMSDSSKIIINNAMNWYEIITSGGETHIPISWRARCEL